MVIIIGVNIICRERSGSVVECSTRDLGAAGSSLIGVTALWSLSKTHFPSLVLVQPRKTRPCLTERLLMGRKESIKQTNKMLFVYYFIYMYVNDFGCVKVA